VPSLRNREYIGGWGTAKVVPSLVGPGRLVPGTSVPGFHLPSFGAFSWNIPEISHEQGRNLPDQRVSSVTSKSQTSVWPGTSKSPPSFSKERRNQDGAPAESLVQDENGRTKTKINADGQECPSYTFAYTKTSPGRAVRVRLTRVF
jgi:hypothetical protein